MLRKLIDSLSLIVETAKKEKQLIFKDGATIEIYMLFTVLVYFFYSFVYSPEIFTKLPLAFVDNDQTTISHEVKRMLDDTESLDIAYDATSLDAAKKLFEEEKVNGIIFGKPYDNKYYGEYKEAIYKVIRNELNLKDLPIMYNMNFGHTAPMMIIPYGTLAEIDCNNKKFYILESGVV